MQALHQRYTEWQRWSLTAERDHDGWESSFPGWNSLIETACEAMLLEERDAETMAAVENCWAISNETEDLADFARRHVEQCLPVLETLSCSTLPDVRWQVFDVLGSAGPRGEQVLRLALADEDPYCRRRAILALVGLRPHEREELVQRLLTDNDPHNRQVGERLKIAPGSGLSPD